MIISLSKALAIRRSDRETVGNLNIFPVLESGQEYLLMCKQFENNSL
jgi:hypothetical protein